MERVLIGIPVHNEENYLAQTLKIVTKMHYNSNYDVEFLVVDDGSTDKSFDIYKNDASVHFVRHDNQRGYGTTISDILNFAYRHEYSIVATIDADLQHDPSTINEGLEVMHRDNKVDIISSSRYLNPISTENSKYVPFDRYIINMTISWLLNKLFQQSATPIKITDAFCGLKLYRTRALPPLLQIAQYDYSYPLKVFFEIARNKLRMVEMPTPLIYLESRRSRADWRHRFEEYLGAIEHSLLNDPQKQFFSQIKPRLWEFLVCKLRIHPIVEDFLPYPDFWQRNIEPHSDFCGICRQNQSASVLD